MTDDKNTEEVPAPALTVAPSGALTVGGMIIGRVDSIPAGDPFVDELRIVLDLGWMKEARVHVLVRGDADVDKKRGGVVLER